MLAVAIVPGKRVCENIKKTWNILDKNYGINYISTNSPFPHITLISGLYEKKNEEIINSINSSIVSTKSMKLCSKGLGVFLIESPLVYLRWKNNKKLIELRNTLLENLAKNKLVNNNSSSNIDWTAKTTICFKDLNYKNNFTNVILTIKEMFTEDYEEEVESLVLIRYLDAAKEKVIQKFSFKSN